MNRNIMIFTIIITFLVACAQQAEKKTEAIQAMTNEGEKALTQAQLAATPQQDLYSDGRTKLIKTAKYRFKVDNVKKSTEVIIAAVRKFPAYISSSSLHLENPVLENKMTIRVQNEYFQDLLLEIDCQAKYVNHRDVTTADVSKDFVDLESRLKTKREVEARYMEILRKKAATIEELLNAEQQIGSLHEEIEATISRINYLREQVSYSTIDLEFYQTVTQDLRTVAEETIKDKFAEALDTGWKGVVAIGIALTYIWPLLLTAVATLLLYRVRKSRTKIA